MEARKNTIGEIAASSRAARLIGRERERATLARCLEPSGPAIVWLHGPAGIGKTALLAAFARDCADAGVKTVWLEGGAVEPRPEDVTSALAAGLGGSAGSVRDLAELIANRAAPTAFLIDDGDEQRLTAVWLRRTLAPALPAGTLLVIASRQPPPLAWTLDFGALFLAIPLQSLDRSDVAVAAAEVGVDARASELIWRLSAGLPLAVDMALQAARRDVLTDDAGTAIDLARMLLKAASNPVLDRLVEATSVVRRANRPLLAAMLGDDPAATLEEFEALPFVQRDSEGLLVSEPVRNAISSRLAAVEPDLHAHLRNAAARWIHERLGAAGPAERWRYMADLLYLLDRPEVRDAFFPPDHPAPLVEPAGAADIAAILEIAERREGAEGRRIVAAWCAALPHRVNVARGPSGAPLAFYSYARLEDPLAQIAREDGLLARWLEEMRRDPPRGSALFLRHMIERAEGNNLPERAACYLDLKRAYLERRDLARIYAAAGPEVLTDPVLRRLGFQPVASEDGREPDTLRLDMPSSGLSGWVAGLLGLVENTPPAAPALDFARDSREIHVDGANVRLTRLEAAVLAALIDRAPRVVGREDLIDTVWQRAFVGSNVVDAVVRTLRAKLGDRRDMIETVPKAGYRFRQDR